MHDLFLFAFSMNRFIVFFYFFIFCCCIIFIFWLVSYSSGREFGWIFSLLFFAQIHWGGVSVGLLFNPFRALAQFLHLASEVSLSPRQHLYFTAFVGGG